MSRRLTAFGLAGGNGAGLRRSLDRPLICAHRAEPTRLVSMATASGVVLCPGQGAQAVGMGKAWIEKSKASKEILDRADAYLGQDRLGGKLSDIMLNGPKERLDRTDIAQPAIFVASMACWEGQNELGLAGPPLAAAGLSLGEYTALVVGGAIDFDAALELVTLRGRAMQDAAESSDGTMAALLGADEDKAKEAVERGLQIVGGETETLVSANFNAPGQVVISGSRSACEAAAKYAMDEMKLKVVMLDVAGAFHSPLMAPAAERLAKALESTTIRAPAIPVMSNVTGKPHASDPDSIRKNLVDQLTNSVRWESCVRYLLGADGVAADAPWVELTPGKTLAGMMRKIDRKKKVLGFDEPPEA